MTGLSFKYKRILVPLDGSKLAERALVPAMVIAESMAAEVHCLQIVTGSALTIDPSLNQRVVRARTQAANIYLQSLPSRFSETKVRIEVATDVGPAAKSITDYAKRNDVDLIVMSSHGRSGHKRWVYGNVAIKILRRAPCDTLMVRPLTDVKLFSKNRVLVPLDGSRRAERALRPALALATAWDMDVLLLYVILPVNVELEPSSIRYMFDDIEAEARADAKIYLQGLKATLIPVHRSVSVATVTGTPAAAIIDYAVEQQADLIAMSSHGRTGAELWIMGSVSEKVLRGANCATLIVRSSQDKG